MLYDASREPIVPDPDAFLDDASSDSRARINRLLLDSLVREGLQDLDAPHLVVCTDLEDGTVSFQGPYADALTALLAAEAESGDISPDISGLRFTVAPLLPPRPLD